MSRCLPYPPPGYSAKRDGNYALIESIKLQREKEKAKAERKKERKREKKERKREKEANTRQDVSALGHGKKRKLADVKAQKWEKERVDSKRLYAQMSGADEAELLESSGLTEEHEQPVCTQNSCLSPDSNKRRQASPVNSIRAHGNILKIRLSSQKHKESDVIVRQERLPSTSGRTGSTGQHNPEISHGRSCQEVCSTSMVKDAYRPVAITPQPDKQQENCHPEPDKQQECSRGTGLFAHDNTMTASIATSSVNEIQRVESLYKDLFENFRPQALRSELTEELDGQEWLFQRKHHDRETSKASISVPHGGGNSSPWPHAQYLPQVDIYALPLTVPF